MSQRKSKAERCVLWGHKISKVSRSSFTLGIPISNLKKLFYMEAELTLKKKKITND